MHCIYREHRFFEYLFRFHSFFTEVIEPLSHQQNVGAVQTVLDLLSDDHRKAMTDECKRTLNRRMILEDYSETGSARRLSYSGRYLTIAIHLDFNSFW